MPNVDVSCAVVNCVFHAKGNICGADKIKIDMDYNSNYDSEFSSELGYPETTEEANQSAETCCKTFKPKQ